MDRADTQLRFEAVLRQPADARGEDGWAFVVLPKEISEAFLRRGRTSMRGIINGHTFQALLEPDGQLSHWFRVPATLMKETGVTIGDTITLDVSPAPDEVEPNVPPELDEVLAASPAAKVTWDATTTIARIDWIHWIESAKQDTTRLKRVADAGDMLASGKKRVCCFDPSGYYSKSLSPPHEAK